MINVIETKPDRFKDLIFQVLSTPQGKELVDLMKERIINSQTVFHPNTTPESDKFYLGRLSVYKEFIAVANKKQKER